MTAEHREILTRGTDEDGKLVENLLPASCFGPLAVHMTWDLERWAVSHIASGYAICTLDSYDGAAEVAEHMALWDWELPNPHRIPGPLRVEVTEYLREMKQKYVDIASKSFDIVPEPHPGRSR